MHPEKGYKSLIQNPTQQEHSESAEEHRIALYNAVNDINSKYSVLEITELAALTVTLIRERRL